MRPIFDVKHELELKKPIFTQENVPILYKPDFESRLHRIIELAKERDPLLTHLIVYADREHYANMMYLCGYDPRFEEALLILNIDDNTQPLLVVGPEGYDYSNIVSIDHNKIVYQSFGLMGQQKGASLQLEGIFKSMNISKHSRVGVLGWKAFSREETPLFEFRIEIPNYIIEELCSLMKRKNIVNRNDLLLDNSFGLRCQLDYKELILHEIAGTKTSYCVYNTIANLKLGLTEMEASSYFEFDGQPQVTYPNLNFGIENVRYGLASPSYYKKLEKGQVIAVGAGYRRSQCHRIGVYANNKSELPDGYDKMQRQYFEALACWYEQLCIGISGGEIFNTVEKVLGPLGRFGVSLNPGHQIHLEEWINSLFYRNSVDLVSSGMVIQCDMIAMPKDLDFAFHMEDGVIVADDELRKIIEEKNPASWRRIQNRRKIMKDVLGIELHSEILPISDLAGIFYPYMADNAVVLSRLGN